MMRERESELRFERGWEWFLPASGTHTHTQVVESSPLARGRGKWPQTALLPHSPSLDALERQRDLYSLCAQEV